MFSPACKSRPNLTGYCPYKCSECLDKQYVGRLHRTDENKEEVEVHDYVDININMFEKMYHERLRGYKRLGYVICGDEVVFERKIYSTNDYRNKLFEDLKECKKEIDLIINDFGDVELNEILDLHNDIKIFTKSNNTIEHKNVCGLYKTNLEINAVIIDQKILWYGGINPFRTIAYNDSVMRINDKSICETILKEARKGNINYFL